MDFHAHPFADAFFGWLKDVASRLVEERERAKDSWEEGGGERGGEGGWGGGEWKVEISAAELNTLASSLAEWEVFMVSSPLNPKPYLKYSAAKYYSNPDAEFPKTSFQSVAASRTPPWREEGIEIERRKR